MKGCSELGVLMASFSLGLRGGGYVELGAFGSTYDTPCELHLFYFLIVLSFDC